MKLLIEQGDYTGAAGYCNDILKVYPDCVDIHFWRFVALTYMGDIALIKDIDNNLKEAMYEKMYSYLQRRLQLEFNISEEQLRNEEEQSVVFMLFYRRQFNAREPPVPDFETENNSKFGG